MNAYLHSIAPLLAPVVAFLVTLAAMPPGIRWLRRLKFGQNVREDGPQSHVSKSGTPTMGGIIFVPIALVCSLLADSRHIAVALAAFTFLGMVIGWLDDYRSIRGGRSLGLKAREKLAMQIVISALFLATVCWIGRTAPLNDIMSPGAARGSAIDWAGDPRVMPLRWLLLCVVSVWLINAANIADGLDGLATSQAFIAILALASWSTFGLGWFCLPMLACLLAFLCYNCPPARVFMGDTGSIALGCFVAGLGLVSVPLWVLLVVTAVWSAESLSVVIQVLYFKLTGGKRIFRMSPIHHHFELCGWPETVVTTRFVVASVICGFFLPGLFQL